MDKPAPILDSQLVFLQKLYLKLFVANPGYIAAVE